MASAPDPHSPYGRQTPLSRRATGLILALAVDALIILALLSLSSSPPAEPGKKGGPITVRLLPDALQSPTQTKKASKQEQTGEKAMAAKTETKRPAPRDSLVKPPPIDEHDLGMLIITREQYAASDIGKMAAPAPKGGDGNAGASGTDSSSDGRGHGPNGERLYNAEWYRKPTDAELRFYLPARMPPSGSALIACRTIERYRVDDCVELGDSPRGFGLARAMREAAWQFLVIPPRVGGKTMVGAWVRIEIVFTERGARTAS